MDTAYVRENPPPVVSQCQAAPSPKAVGPLVRLRQGHLDAPVKTKKLGCPIRHEEGEVSTCQQAP